MVELRAAFVLGRGHDPFGFGGGPREDRLRFAPGVLTALLHLGEGGALPFRFRLQGRELLGLALGERAAFLGNRHDDAIGVGAGPGEDLLGLALGLRTALLHVGEGRTLVFGPRLQDGKLVRLAIDERAVLVGDGGDDAVGVGAGAGEDLLGLALGLRTALLRLGEGRALPFRLRLHGRVVRLVLDLAAALVRSGDEDAVGFGVGTGEDLLGLALGPRPTLLRLGEGRALLFRLRLHGRVVRLVLDLAAAFVRGGGEDAVGFGVGAGEDLLGLALGLRSTLLRLGEGRALPFRLRLHLRRPLLCFRQRLLRPRPRRFAHVVGGTGRCDQEARRLHVRGLVAPGLGPHALDEPVEVGAALLRPRRRPSRPPRAARVRPRPGARRAWPRGRGAGSPVPCPDYGRIQHEITISASGARRPWSRRAADEPGEPRAVVEGDREERREDDGPRALRVAAGGGDGVGE